jgi:hypothetical protein
VCENVATAETCEMLTNVEIHDGDTDSVELVYAPWMRYYYIKVLKM